MFVIFSLIIEMLFCSIIKDNIENYEIVSIILIMINTLICLIWICSNRKIDKGQKLIFILGLLIRVILLYVDLYIKFLPSSGGDSEGFHMTAIGIANNISLIFQDVYGGIYTKILGLIYYLIGTQRLFVQSLNIFIGIATAYLVVTILNNIAYKKDKRKYVITAIVVFLPQGLVFSSILLREAVIAFFVTLSFKYCLDWIKNKKTRYILLAIITLLVASSFHAGVLLIISGYCIVFSFYNHDAKKLRVSFNRVMILLAYVILATLIYFRLGYIFADKIQGINIDKIEKDLSISSTAGSAYLGGKEINGIRGIIIYSIPKAIYFLFSPMPWNWRGIVDAGSFMLDSIIYIFLTYSICRNMIRNQKEQKDTILMLLLGIIISIFVFGLGTSTAGTAIRHRHKLIYCIIVCYIISGNKEGINAYKKFD